MGLAHRTRFVKGFFNESLPRALQALDPSASRVGREEAAHGSAVGAEGGEDDVLPNHSSAFSILR